MSCFNCNFLFQNERVTFKEISINKSLNVSDVCMNNFPKGVKFFAGTFHTDHGKNAKLAPKKFCATLSVSTAFLLADLKVKFRIPDLKIK